MGRADFLRSSEAAEVFAIGGGHLRRYVRPHLHRLQIKVGATTLYSARYTRSLLTWKDAQRFGNTKPTLIQMAQDFSITQEARQLVEDTEKRLERQIEDRVSQIPGISEPVIGLAGITAALGVSRDLVKKWSGDYRALRQIEEHRYLFPLGDFNTIYTWHRPELMTGGTSQPNRQ